VGVAEPAAAIVCRRIRVRGQVQGVGFRPHAWRLARELGLVGWVRNDGEGVEIEAQGPRAAIDALVERLQRQPPPLARVTGVETRARPTGPAVSDFVIAASTASRADTAVTPDTAVCADCLRELFDPANRRWRHAFANCTNCGPRYTITRALPYDRPQTSMAAFVMCPQCRREYESPADRRFHAQPNACPECGPRLRLCDLAGSPLDADRDPIAATVARLARGEIVAIKSVGGFHLACDARQADVVARLRERKQRDEKPFALMLANVGSAAAFAEVDEAERAALESPERPIVLLHKVSVCDEELPSVAPGLAELGVMLPSAPLHFLLFHEAAGRPAGTGWLTGPQPLALVMTSANPGGEPIVRDDDEACARLAGIADAVLLHDRAIVTRCDDSVLRAAGGTRRFVRRARGYTPRAIRLPHAGPPVLAVGAMLKATVCLTRGDQAFVSQHVGDLDNVATVNALEEVVERLTGLLQIEPERVACDRHPDFAGSLLAARWAGERGLPRVEVQHHHAHIAAVAAEHGLTGPVLGLALDGHGLGDDGAAWGGEWLVVDGAAMRRVGHLAPLRLPGGDRAALSPWRMAAAALHAIGRGKHIARRYAGEPAAAGVAGLLERGLHAPWTTSAGRWFDAAAGLLGVAHHASYEGQAAMRLEALASRHGPVEPLVGGWRLTGCGRSEVDAAGEPGIVLDATPLLAHLADETDAARGAATFHATLADGLAAAAIAAARAEGLARVVLGGGCWLNRLLAAAVERRLRAAGLEVWQACDLPPGDGGLSLGQAWVAMQSEG
jgi:hydrogenase maturation protein HypF